LLKKTKVWKKKYWKWVSWCKTKVLILRNMLWRMVWVDWQHSCWRKREWEVRSLVLCSNKFNSLSSLVPLQTD